MPTRPPAPRRMTDAEFRRIRKRLGLSQRALGERLGLTTGHVSRLECGVVPITPTIANFLRLLGEHGGKRR